MPGYIEVRVSIIMTGSHDFPVWRLRMIVFCNGSIFSMEGQILAYNEEKRVMPKTKSDERFLNPMKQAHINMLAECTFFPPK